MPTDVFLGLRFLWAGGLQTVLILAGVSVGVGVVVFLSGLIAGLQQSLIDRTLGSQAHVSLSAPEEVARPQIDLQGRHVLRIVEQPAQRLRSIPEWQQDLDVLTRTPGVLAAAPLVDGPAFASRGSARRSITLTGIDPETYARVIPIDAKIVRGAYDVDGTGALIGVELARELGVDVGDEIRVVTAGDRAQLVRVRGVFDLGNKDANERWVFVGLRSGQTLHGLAGGASRIDVRVEEIFDAEIAARAFERDLGLPAVSWMERNEQLLVGLRSQSQSSNLIQVFVAIAVAMGIASVLAVSVVQRSREIGILRAMGTPRAMVLRIFLWQGATVGLVGSVLGSGLGVALSAFFQNLATADDGGALFPIDLSAPRLIAASAVATLTGLLAAVAPARRAARLDPAVAMRSL